MGYEIYSKCILMALLSIYKRNSFIMNFFNTLIQNSTKKQNVKDLHKINQISRKPLLYTILLMNQNHSSPASPYFLRISNHLNIAS